MLIEAISRRELEHAERLHSAGRLDDDVGAGRAVAQSVAYRGLALDTSPRTARASTTESSPSRVSVVVSARSSNSLGVSPPGFEFSDDQLLGGTRDTMGTRPFLDSAPQAAKIALLQRFYDGPAWTRTRDLRIMRSFNP